MISFGYTILYVVDVEQTLSFYEQVFGFERKFITDEADYGELVSGTTTLAFASIELGKSHDTSMSENSKQHAVLPFEIAFTTDEVEKYFQKALDRGAISVVTPEQKPWGQTVSYIRDINGFLVEICSPII